MTFWRKVCEDPVVGITLLLVIMLAAIFIPILVDWWRDSVKGLFKELQNYLFAPRKYPWIRGWGKKKWLDQKRNGEKLSWEA